MRNLQSSYANPCDLEDDDPRMGSLRLVSDDAADNHPGVSTMQGYGVYRVVITGSRHWKRHNKYVIANELDELHERYGDFLEVGHGASKGGGVDSFVEEICNQRDIYQYPFPVRSDLDGRHRGAPLNRNERMVREFKPDLVIAFRSSGKSNGTDKTLKFAESLRIETRLIHEP